MRLVFDTNIFVSFLINPANIFRFLADCLDSKKNTLLYSNDSLTELLDVLQRRKFSRYIALSNVTALTAKIVDTGEFVWIDRDIRASRNPKDDMLLALAVCGRADYLVTGDRDLLVLNKIEDTLIVFPADFLRVISH